jgi:hypothetical protein
MRRISISNLFAVMCFVALLAAPGCGGGGGGGGSTGGTTPTTPAPSTPIVSLSSPTPTSSISDVDFRAESFDIRFSYSDTSAMDPSTLSVTLKMDNGAAQNISSYFSQTNSTTIQSSNIYQFTRTLFDLPSNTVSRTMTITASIRSQAGITGTTSSSFTVYPLSPAPPPPSSARHH